jgi:hypothetical protein
VDGRRTCLDLVPCAVETLERGLMLMNGRHVVVSAISANEVVGTVTLSETKHEQSLVTCCKLAGATAGGAPGVRCLFCLVHLDTGLRRNCVIALHAGPNLPPCMVHLQLGVGHGGALDLYVGCTVPAPTLLFRLTPNRPHHHGTMVSSPG